MKKEDLVDDEIVVGIQNMLKNILLDIKYQELLAEEYSKNTKEEQ